LRKDELKVLFTDIQDNQEVNFMTQVRYEKSKLVIFPTPGDAVLRNDYKVFVRGFGEETWNELACYEVKVDMHDVRKASMAYFDFEGQVEVKIQYNNYMHIYQVDVRPLAQKIKVDFSEKEIYFTLEHQANLSIEINRDRFHNLHLFAGNIQNYIPDVDCKMVKYLPGNLDKALIHRTEEIGYELEKMPKGRTLYFGPGIHYLEECVMRIPSDTNVYIAGGAIIVGTFVCSKVENIKIFGRGVLYLARFERFSGLNAIRLSHAKNIEIEGIHFINPPHYSVYIGGSDNVQIKDIKSFSCEGWSDGIDMMSSKNVIVDGVFLRTSDDCIAIYGRRWDYNGNTVNVLIQNSVLWADVAHPTNIGCHGDYHNDGNVIEKICFRNLDILEHHEPQSSCLGCMNINVGDKNIVRDVLYENIRVEKFEHGKLLDLQIICGGYNLVPGKIIEDIHFKDIFYDGVGEVTAVINGVDEERKVQNITFDNLVIRGKRILTAEQGNIQIGEFAENIIFK
jgi:hypothetical protein